MRLGTVHPAFPGHSAGTDGNDRLQSVEPGAERIGARVQKREHALTLVVVKRIPNNRQSDQNAGNQQQQEFPA